MFLRRLTWPAAERARLTASRTGALDIRRDATALRAFSICVLESCVYSEAREGARYFGDLHEAAEWADSLDPELQVLTHIWLNTSLGLNPLLIPADLRGQDVPELRDEATRAADQAALDELLRDVPARPVADEPTSAGTGVSA